MLSFSIVIPAFNAQDTIKRCLDSVISQQYTEFEVVVVDDGSTDATGMIIENYRCQDSRIILKTQNNKGPSAARNLGIDCSSGEVVCFVDSDDFIEPDYLAEIANAFERSNADVVFWGFRRLSTEGKEISEHLPPPEKDDYYSSLMELSGADTFGYTWIKALKRDLIHSMRYDPTMDLFEDEVFTCSVLRAPCRIAIIPKVLYNYFFVPGSLARKPRKDLFRYCESVYLSWKTVLINSHDVAAQVFLREKANHFVQICKYSCLEGRLEPIAFYRDFMKCSFLADSSVNDSFVEHLKEHKLPLVLLHHYIYIVANAIRKTII